MFYSPTTNAFYDPRLKSRYEAAGTWPDDAIEVPSETFRTYGQGQAPEGKMRGAVDGMPAWVDVPAPPFQDQKTRRLARLATYRWQVETGGLSWNGYGIPTDDRSKTLINAAADRARRSGAAPSAGWKISADTWIDATVQQMKDLQEAVEAFVDACFSRERALAQDILAATDEAALDAVDIESGWPADSVLAGGGS